MSPPSFSLFQLLKEDSKVCVFLGGFIIKHRFSKAMRGSILFVLSDVVTMTLFLGFPGLLMLCSTFPIMSIVAPVGGLGISILGTCCVVGVLSQGAVSPADLLQAGASHHEWPWQQVKTLPTAPSSLRTLQFDLLAGR